MTRMMIHLLSAASLALGLGAPSLGAAAVYPGCVAPPPIPSGNVHYVDPVNGSMSGDGTQAHPWHTLGEVLAAGLFYNTPVHGQPHINPSAPIQAGDTIYLLSGNQGAVRIQGWFGGGLVGYDNSSFITIAAATGATPVLSQLSIVGASKWVFQGLTIQSLNNTGTFAAGGSSSPDYWLVGFVGPHNNIVFNGNNLSSTNNAGTWGLLDWLTQRASGIGEHGGSCVTISGNNLTNIGFGIATQSSSNVLITNNIINYFTDDGIDFGSNNVLISGNTITNSVEDGDGFHRDGMQGQPYSEQTTLYNIKISENTIIRLTDPGLQYPGYLQGIDSFDGAISNMSLSNNTVITDAHQGISFYGVKSVGISNNILVGDSGKVLACSGLTFSQCQSTSVTYDTSTVPTIAVESSKAGVPSTLVTVSNNISTGITADLNTTNSNISSNLCVLTSGKCVIGIPENGVMLWVALPGRYANNNVISNRTAYTEFVLYDPTSMHYIMTPR